MTGMSVLIFFYPFLEVTSLKKHIILCVKDSSAEGPCKIIKEP